MRSSSGSTWYLTASFRKRSCSSLSFAGFFAARSFARAEVLVDVVEFPLVFEERAPRLASPRRRGGRCGPASRRGRCRGCRRSRSTASCAGPSPWRRRRCRPCSRLRWASAACRSPIFGSGRPAASRIVGAMSMTWCHCDRTSPLALIPLGQWTTSALRRAAEAAGDLLRPGERRVAGHGPAGGVVAGRSSGRPARRSA